MKVLLTKRAQKDLDKLPEPQYLRIKQAFILLAQNFNSADISKLTNQPGYRLRVGTYRVLFIRDRDTIIISRIKHRREVYR